MSNRLLFVFIFSLLYTTAFSQRYVIEKGSISFFSKATIEDILAENKKVNSIFSTSNGGIAFSVSIKAFEFEKKLMQEHFNDKYLESDRYPQATFAGVVTGYDLNRTGVQNVRAKGKLMIHGITKEIDVPGTLEAGGGRVTLKSTFKVKLVDYGVTIPQVLWQNIAEQVDVTVNLTYKQQ